MVKVCVLKDASGVNMAILVDDIVNRAKKIWREAGTEFSSFSAEWISDGVIELRSLRPESTKFDSDLNPVEFAEAALGGSIAIDIKFRPCLVDYLISRGFAENTRIEESNKYYSDFVKKALVA